MTDKVSAELARWIDGDEVVARRAFEFGTQIAITRNENGYSIYRAFPLGENGAGVSADLQEVPVEQVLTQLLSDVAA